MGPLKHLALLVVLATTLVNAQPADGQGKAKAIGIFNIVKFPNDVCETDSTATPSGTCFTAEECTDKGGIASGTCADGYGVCCVITLACSGRTSENCTYLSQASTTTPPAGGCTYEICPGDSTVNRIRLDLTMFNIAGPFLPATSNADHSGSSSATGGCTTDSFTVTGTRGPYPVICGVNTGQHMIVDTDGSACVKATFSYGMASSTRQYSIHATQFASSNEMGGPPGCLQFFTGATGTVSSFNWQGTTTRTSSVHLQDQNYIACVRQELGSCVVCWSPTTTGNQATTTGSFGVSASAIATSSTGDSGTSCTTDFVVIESASAATNAAAVASGTGINSAAVSSVGTDKICGRFFAATNPFAPTADGTICTRSTPFTLGVVTDGSESLTGAAGAADTNELADGTGDATMDNAPFGTQGFSLGFSQIAC